MKCNPAHLCAKAADNAFQHSGRWYAGLSSIFSPILLIVLLGLATCLFSGCAVSSAAIVDEEHVSNTKPIASYAALRIHEFELKREMVTSSGDDAVSERERRYLGMPSEVAAKVEQLVSRRQIFQTVSRTPLPKSNALILKGIFTRISRFKVSVTGRLFDGDTDREVAMFRLTLWDVYDTSQTIEMLSQETADFIDKIQYK